MQEQRTNKGKREGTGEGKAREGEGMGKKWKEHERTNKGKRGNQGKARTIHENNNKYKKKCKGHEMTRN